MSAAQNAAAHSAPEPFVIRHRAWFLGGLLVLCGVSVYANGLAGPFVFDDHNNIVDDASIRSLWPPWQALADTNRPVLKLSFALNHALGGLDVRGYHAVNVAIHVLAALVLFGLVRRTLASRQPGSSAVRNADGWAFATALLWLVHPLQTQAVTYVVQRGEVLMGLFYLLTLYCTVRSAELGGTRKRAFEVAAVAACALGMGTKEVMLSAPIAVLLYDRTFLAPSLAAALRARWPLYLGLASTWVLLAALLGHDRGGGFGMDVTPLVYLRTQPGVILHYLRLALWPDVLCLDRAWPMASDAARIVPHSAALALLLGACIHGTLRRAWWGFVGAFFLLVLIPTSSVMPILDAAFEHRLYLSLASLCVLAVVLAGTWLERFGGAARPAGALLLLALATALGTRTMLRNRDYASVVSIWRSTVEAAPHNPRAQANLGQAYLSLGELELALEHLGTALRLDPHHAVAHNNLALALVRLGRPEQALGHYDAAIRDEPGFAADVLLNQGDAFLALGRHDEALDAWERSARIRPDAKAALRGATLLRQLGQLEAAAHGFQRALDLDPTRAEAHAGLGEALLGLDRPAAAIPHLQRALALRPLDLRTKGLLDQAVRATQR